MDKIDILYATNKKYLFVTLASLVSLMENANLALDTKININLMTEGLVKEDYKLLEEIISLYPAFKLTVYPIEEFNIEKYNIPKWLNTQVANARLFFQEILGDKVKNMEKILYLDSDTIVIDDLRGLEKYQEGIYAVKDSALPSYCRKLNVDNYYNSGVLYLDPKNWIENNYQEKIVDFVKYNRDFDFSYPDQDLINVVLKDELKPLEESYNVSPFMFSITDRTLDYYCKVTNNDYRSLKENIRNPKIIHTCGFLGIKPWMDNAVNPYNDIYRYYLRRVNANFEVENLTGIKEFLGKHPRLFYSLLLLKTYTPDSLQNSTKKLALKFYTKK